MGHIRLYVATSLDGRVADRDGGVGWLDDFDTPEHGASYAAFIKNIETIVMGRATFDQVLTFGAWPYGGMRTIVVTSRSIEQPPPDTDPLPVEQLDRVIGELRARDRDAWLVGGGRTVEAFLEREAIDEMEIHVMPLVLGAGPLLFPGPSAARLTCVETKALSKGVVKLRYKPDA